jgi:putative two-component system response regulator
MHLADEIAFQLLEGLREPIEAHTLIVIGLVEGRSMYIRRRALALGASDFLTKPVDRIELSLRVRNLLETQLLQQQLQNQNLRLRDMVRERTEELEFARKELLERLAHVAEYRDYTTAEHTDRVGHIASLIAGRLDLDAELVETMRDAAPLHDIGKLAVPDSVLLKTGPLTAQERRMMQRHVRVGADLLGGSISPTLRLGQEIALYHHERWDGSGYDAHLTGEAIPLSGRITAIADVFDALTHERPYKPAMPVRDAVAEIMRQAGRQFDPALVQVFSSLDHAVLL